MNCCCICFFLNLVCRPFSVCVKWVTLSLDWTNCSRATCCQSWRKWWAPMTVSDTDFMRYDEICKCHFALIHTVCVKLSVETVTNRNRNQCQKVGTDTFWHDCVKSHSQLNDCWTSLSLFVACSGNFIYFSHFSWLLRQQRPYL